MMAADPRARDPDACRGRLFSRYLCRQHNQGVVRQPAMARESRAGRRSASSSASSVSIAVADASSAGVGTNSPSTTCRLARAIATVCRRSTSPSGW